MSLTFKLALSISCLLMVGWNDVLLSLKMRGFADFVGECQYQPGTGLGINVDIGKLFNKC